MITDSFGQPHCYQRGLCMYRDWEQSREHKDKVEVERRAYVRVRFVKIYNAFEILKNDIPRSRWEDYCTGIKAEVW